MKTQNEPTSGQASTWNNQPTKQHTQHPLVLHPNYNSSNTKLQIKRQFASLST
jgi:hypothetical protein